MPIAGPHLHVTVGLRTERTLIFLLVLPVYMKSEFVAIKKFPFSGDRHLHLLLINDLETAERSHN